MVATVPFKRVIHMNKHKSILSQQIHLSKFGFGPIRCHSSDCAVPVAIATSVSALLTTQPSMMLDCLKFVVMAIAIVAVVQASSGQADDNNSSAAAEQVCGIDQECSFLPGVFEIPYQPISSMLLYVSVVPMQFSTSSTTS
jgi:hypothetical protein